MAEKNACPGCGGLFLPRGLPRHLKSCLPGRDAMRQQDLVIAASEAPSDAQEPASTYQLPRLLDLPAVPRKQVKAGHEVRSTIPPEPPLSLDRPPQEKTNAGMSEFRLPRLKPLSNESPTLPRIVSDTTEFRLPRLKPTSDMDSMPMPETNASGYQQPRLRPTSKKSTEASRKQSRSVESRLETTVPEPSVAVEAPQVPRVDDFQTVYHPRSNRAPEVKAFEDYGHENVAGPAREEPWLPFYSEDEFAFAEMMLDLAIPNKQIDKLIKLIRHVGETRHVFQFKNHKDLDNLWSTAAQLNGMEPFTSQKISVPYRGNSRSFDFWSRPLFQWAINVVEDPYLAGLCEWDAVKLSKFDGKEWVPFVSEPWTGKRMWDFQSKLPEHAKPLCITLYADKTRLSSFGTVQGYPIMAQINNLPAHIRNSRGLGSVQVVGWLPIVDENEADSGKTDFANFKGAIWHESFRVFLKEVAIYSKTGYYAKCGDGIERHLFPFIFILAADYEEQAIMALTRGVNGLYPCPVCLVPNKDQGDLLHQHPLRTSEASEELVKKSINMPSNEGEKLLKSKSLRPVLNAFWDIPFSGPHEALAFDEMHNNDSGLGGKHFWPLVKYFLDLEGRDAKQKVDDQVKALPTWPGFHHFKQVVSIQFSDANHFRDLMKVLIFITHNILTDGIGYLVLKCVRGYLDMVMWESLEVHTKHTIAAGRTAITHFGALILELDEVLKENGIDKKFDFPKLHAHQHAFESILEKGPLHHYTTRIFEGLHPPLKKWFQRRSNFKDTASQVLDSEFRMLVCYTMRNAISMHNDALSEADNSIKNSDSDTASFGNVKLGAPQKPCSFNDIEHAHQNNQAFHQFFSHASKLVHDLLQRPDSPVHLPNDYQLSIKPEDMLIEYRFIKATYESCVDWRAHTDNLRCSPEYRKAPRYDCVLIHNTPQNYFGRLLFVFAYTIYVDGKKSANIPMALVQPFEDVLPLRQKDIELRLIRLRAKPQKQATIIPARSIIRGVRIVPEGQGEPNFLLFDPLDTDMFVRMYTMYPSLNVTT